jgi:hypothetical protein
MRLLIHPPSKNGVTRVTGVMGDIKPLNILSFTPVTRLRTVAYTSCNAAPGCYTESPSLPLLASHFRRVRTSSARWLCLNNIGRGDGWLRFGKGMGAWNL